MLGAWVGFALLVLVLALAYFRARANRKSGKTQSYGRPLRDNLLLLGAGVLLATVLTVVLWLSRSGWPFLQSRVVLYPLILSMGALLTWACNRFLRKK
jgi:multisubunit Na+/H+ antiporter MnhB subunit